MEIALGKLFDLSGVKAVTKTDKAKEAYVLTKEQVSVLDQAGIPPKLGASFRIVILNEPHLGSVEASYYHSERAQADRTPEPRLGREIIRSWMELGDEVLIGNIGTQVFALKLKSGSVLDVEGLLAEAAQVADRESVIDRASRATGKPERREVLRQDFVRDPFVVRGALIRADGRCETPGCKAPLFLRDDGAPYLEVHHILPLGEEGEDSLANVAALCPHCHRELHFGAGRKDRRAVLSACIAEVEKRRPR